MKTDHISYHSALVSEEIPVYCLSSSRAGDLEDEGNDVPVICSSSASMRIRTASRWI